MKCVASTCCFVPHKLNTISRMRCTFSEGGCLPSVARCVIAETFPRCSGFQKSSAVFVFGRSQEAMKEPALRPAARQEGGSGPTHSCRLLASHSCVSLTFKKKKKIRIPGQRAVNVSFRSTDCERCRLWRSQMARE